MAEDTQGTDSQEGAGDGQDGTGTDGAQGQEQQAQDQERGGAQHLTGDDAGKDGGEKKPAGNWRDNIQDEKLRGHAERFTTPEDLVKSHLDLRTKLSSAIFIPGKDADEKDIQAFRKAIGVPEKPEGYEFKMPEGKEAGENDKAFQEAARQAFHKLGIPAPAAAGLNAWWNEMTSAMQAAQVEADKQYAAQTEAALKKEWGDDYDRNHALANKALESFFEKEGKEAFQTLELKDGRLLGDHPEVVKAFAKIGREMVNFGPDPALATNEQTTIQEKFNDLQKRKMDARNAGKTDEAERLDAEQAKLYERLHGTAPIIGTEGRAA